MPIAGCGLLLVVFFLRLRPIDASSGIKLRRLDWIGMILFTVGSVAFVLPLSWAGAIYPWGSCKTLLPLIIGLLLLLFFVHYESRPAEPVLPLRLFASVTAVVMLFGSFIHGMVVYGLMEYLPLFFQAVVLQTPLQSALSLLPLSVTTVVFSALSAIAVERFRKYTWNIWLGWILLVLGVGFLSLLDSHVSTAVRVGPQVIAGVGIGSLYCILVLPLQASVPNVDDTGLAVGLLVSFRLFGALVGLAMGSAIFGSVFTQAVEQLEGDLPQPLWSTLSSGNEAIHSELEDVMSPTPRSAGCARC